VGALTYVLGGYQTDFARHLAREGKELADLVKETVEGTLAAAGVEPEDIGAIHVANAFGELFCHQSQLGAMPATVCPALWGIPAVRHEAACASGSVAVLAAQAAIQAGQIDCALVLGVEQERHVSGEMAARNMGAAAWTGHEGEGARYLWPHMFARIADIVNPPDEALAAIAKKNLDYAKQNPLAQTRGWTYSTDVDKNPVVEGRLRRNDCAQITDGAAGIVLASERFARGAKILGWGHKTAGLSLDLKLARKGEYLFPHLRAAITAAGCDAVEAVELHDCFSVTEYVATQHLALPIADPRINQSGGLIGGGHPVGATGVRMVLDAAKMIARGAGRVGTLNIGGSFTTVVSFVLGSGS
jgi:acetyl-CoA C-acetyltransferase